MCEKDDLDEMYEISRSRDLSRRQFGALSLGVGLTALLPRLQLRCGRHDRIGNRDQDARRHLRCPFRASCEGQISSGLDLAGHFRFASGIQADGKTPG